MAKSESPQRVSSTAAVIAALGAAALAGCSADIASYALVTTDKYQYYDCDSLADQVKGMTAREKKLEELMAKAGPVISAVSYETEYVSVRGELRELRRTAAQKHCVAKPDRPGAVQPAQVDQAPPDAGVPRLRRR
jgi:hypothetical protein